MPDTIEEFVAKLQDEGVKAGQTQAQTIRAEARKQAEQTLSDAKAQAERIVADADARAREVVSRGQTELELAARDMVLRLQEALSKALQGVVGAAVSEKLSDPDFLGQLLHELILLYARSDLTNGILIDVEPEMKEKLVGWALHEIARDPDGGGHMRIDLKGTLQQAGFEYNVSGGTIEVTRDSVVEVLGELVAPRLREVIDRAIGEAGQ